MEQSASIKELATSLCAAQAMYKPVARNADNPFFRSTYADYEAVFMALQEPFAKNGLSFVQATDVAPDGDLIVETQLMHVSGEWIRGKLKMPPASTSKKKDEYGNPISNDPNRKATPQELGSAFTYACRYALRGMSGIPVQGEDDDGAAGSGTTGQGQGNSRQSNKGGKRGQQNPPPAQQAPPAQPPQGAPDFQPDAPATDKQLDFMQDLLTKAGIGTATVLTRFKKEKLSELTQEECRKVSEGCAKKIEKAQKEAGA